MKSQELCIAVAKALESAQSKIKAHDLERANNILQKVPEIVRLAAEKGERTVTVLLLEFHDLSAANEKETIVCTRANLVGRAAIIYDKCKEAGLDPRIIRDKQDLGWNIVIHW